jgi:hypothetical protein
MQISSSMLIAEEKNMSLLASNYPLTNEVFFLVSITAMQYLEEELDALEVALMNWFRIHQPELFTDAWQAFHDSFPPSVISGLRSKSKRDFFETCLRLLSDTNTERQAERYQIINAVKR